MTDPLPPEPADSVPSTERRAAGDRMEELRELLFGAERRALCEILLRLSDTHQQIEELSRLLPSAVARCHRNEEELSNALLPAVQEAIKQSAAKNPAFLADVLGPVLRPVINRWLVRWTVFLFLLALGLFVAVGYLLVRTGHLLPTASRSPPTTNAPPLNTAARNETRPTVKTNEFNWRQLESEDYRTYIARLRAIGCPDQTIRDLVIADVDRLMAPRVRAVAPRKKELKYWQTDEKELWDLERRALIRKQRQDIDFEKRDIVWQLMGIDLVAERLRLQGEEDPLAVRMSSLSEEKRNQIRRIHDACAEQELRIREKQIESGVALTDDDQAELRRLFKERDQQIVQVLSPVEFELYQLWFSPTAYKVRQALFGMNPTESEFRAIYELTKAFDDSWEEQTVDSNSETARQERERAKTELESRIKALLGDARYAEYKRNQDPDFQALALTVARFKLPPNTAEEVYETKNVIDVERARILASNQLTPEQKKAVLNEMADATEKTVKALLGEQALGYYRRQGLGGWTQR
jgi:hypothetical protein